MREQNKSTLSLEDLLKNVCMITGVDAGVMRQPSKERALARARAIFCCLAVREYGYTGKAAGEVAGLGSAGVSIAVQRGGKLLEENQAMKKMIVARGNGTIER